MHAIRIPLIAALLGLVVLSMAAAPAAHGQTNLATSATATSSGGGSGTYGPARLNDGNITSGYFWVSTTGNPSANSWFQFIWTANQTFRTFTCHIPSTTTRYLQTARVEYTTNGTTWITDHTFAAQSTLIYTINLSATRTCRGIRIRNLTTTGGQSSNPNMYEWQVFNGPPAPTITVPVSSSGNYTVNWGTVAGATSYTLQESTTARFTTATTRYTGTNTSFAFTGKAVGTYYYRVSATDTNGTSGYMYATNTHQVILPPTTPASISVPSTSATGSYTVSWSSSTGATSYTLQEDTVATFTTPTTVYTGASTSYGVTGKTTGTFYYRVLASNIAGSSGWRTGTTGCTIVAPAAPSSISVPTASGTGNYTISWNSSSGATSYTLQESTSATFATTTQIYLGASTSFGVTGNLAGTYYYRVLASNAVGSSVWRTGTNSCVVAAPSAPATLTVPTSSTTGSYTVSWSSSVGASSYTLQESTSATFATTTQVYLGAATSYGVTGKTSGTFYYRVLASSTLGSSGWTNGSNGCQIVAPSPPASITVPTGSVTGNYTISWSSSTGATSYTLEESTSATFATSTQLYNGISTSYGVTGNTAGTYYYRVLASSAVGSSAWRTGTNSCVVGPPPPPATLTVPTGSTTGSYTVTWSSSTGATSYTLEESTSATFATTTAIYTGAATSYGVTGKTTGTYYYRVQASAAIGSSAWTNGSNGCVVAPPAPPASITVPTPSYTGGYTVTWAGSTGATGYTLEEDTTPGFTGPTTVYTGAATSFAASGKSAGTYYYRVLASSAVGSGAWAVGANGCLVTAPSPPATLTVPATSSSGNYSVSWASSIGATSYTLEEDTSVTFATATTVYTGANLTYAVTGKVSGTCYYRVSATGPIGTSAWMTDTTGCTIVPPAPPATVTVPLSSTGDHTVTWTASVDATSYTLQEDTSATFSAPTILYTGANLTYNVTGRSSGTFYYRVSASNAVGPSTWTAGANGCTITPPLAPTPLTVPATSSTGTYNVTWGSSVGAGTYTLEEDTDSGFATASVVMTGAGLTYTALNKPNGIYYYRVKAANGAGDSAWTADVIGCTVTLVAPVDPLVVTVPLTSSTGNYVVSWTAAAGATSYTLEEATDAGFASPTALFTGRPRAFFVINHGTGTYYYRVRPENSAGPGSWNQAFSGCTVGISVPSSPFTITVPLTSNGTTSLSWSSVSSATSYELVEATSSLFTDGVTIYAGPATTYDAAGRTDGSYSYRVRAVSAAGTSAWTEGTNATAVTVTGPEATVYPGPAHAPGSTERAGTNDVPALQIKVTAGSDEGIELQTLTVSASGTGDDYQDLSLVELWLDANGNGIVDGGTDTLIDSGTFTVDDGNLTFTMTATPAIPALGSATYLVTIDLKTTAAPGSTYSLFMSPGSDLTAQGETSATSLVPTGNAVTGGFITVADFGAGSLTVTAGPNNPASSVITAATTGVAMLQVRLSASSMEDLSVTSVKVSSAGSGDETGVTATLYIDGDNSGDFSAGDTTLGVQVFPMDDGVVEFAISPALTLSAGQTQILLVEYDFPAGLDEGSFISFVEVNAAILAEGDTSILGVTPAGAPIYGGIKDLIIPTEASGTGFIGECGGIDGPAGWLTWLLGMALIAGAWFGTRRLMGHSEA